jgi:hypothetical protein
MWLNIAIAIGLVVWAVGGLIVLNPLPWHIRKYWDAPGEKELRIIQAIALLLIIAGVTIFFVTEPGTFWHDLWPEMISTGGAVLGIDELNRRRSAQEYKRGIIQQMASLSNDFALDAARIAKDEKWLEDGSFEGADLWRANLAGSYLRGANLAGTILWRAKLVSANLRKAKLVGADLREATLEGADLREANLEGAELGETNFEGADLRGANFEGTDLMKQNLTGALYDEHTQWPEGFDPTPKGAISEEKLNREERAEWRAKYRPRHQ